MVVALKRCEGHFVGCGDSAPNKQVGIICFQLINLVKKLFLLFSYKKMQKNICYATRMLIRIYYFPVIYMYQLFFRFPRITHSQFQLYVPNERYVHCVYNAHKQYLLSWTSAKVRCNVYISLFFRTIISVCIYGRIYRVFFLTVRYSILNYSGSREPILMKFVSIYSQKIRKTE